MRPDGRQLRTDRRRQNRTRPIKRAGPARQRVFQRACMKVSASDNHRGSTSGSLASRRERKFFFLRCSSVNTLASLVKCWLCHCLGERQVQSRPLTADWRARRCHRATPPASTRRTAASLVTQNPPPLPAWAWWVPPARRRASSRTRPAPSPAIVPAITMAPTRRLARSRPSYRENLYLSLRQAPAACRGRWPLYKRACAMPVRHRWRLGLGQPHPDNSPARRSRSIGIGHGKRCPAGSGGQSGRRRNCEA
jgi:hypothetical protein